MRAILAAGGTGGHVIPALAIAQELRTRFDAEVMFVGTSRGIENRLVPAAGYALRQIEIGALKKVTAATRLKTLFSLPRAIFRAHLILAEFRPEVVIGVGGYASGPVMMAAALSSIPTLAFEPNVVPGLANRIAGTMVSAAAVQFAETGHYFRRCRVTGVPVRREFFTTAAERGNNPLRHPAYGQGRPTLLVFGGSQGSSALNHAVLQSLERLRNELPELHLVHQTGERDYQSSQVAYLHASISAEIYPFIDDMPDAFRHADLLLCRSGASTVAEVMAAGKAAIFVPFPHAADNHQRRNAEALVRNGAALLIPESELTPERLVATIKSLLANPARLADMAAAAKAMAHFDAAGEIATLAARLAGYLQERAITTEGTENTETHKGSERSD